MGTGISLPEDAKRTLIKAKICAGSIFYLPCNFITPPHSKYVVIAHIDFEEDLILVFLINSEIHALIEKDPALKASQVDILKKDYPFLDHDSHLDCIKVFDDYSVDEIVDDLLHDYKAIKGLLSDEYILKILEAVNCAVDITNYDKALIMASLGE